MSGRGAPRGKRALDLAGALVLLVAAAPVLVAAALAIRLDSPGPALFRQRRIGRHGAPFDMWKLRTMVDGADPALHRAHVARLMSGSRGAWRAPSADPRVTRVGRLLRTACIDELPQLWNVLRGEMSLVGPRPALPYEVAAWSPRQRARLAAVPGLTGLWQVDGRGATSFEEMVDLDLAYLERRSLRLDLAILARTPLAVWRAARAAAAERA